MDHEHTSDEIDWNDQWQKHAYGFKDGFAHIDFKKLGLKKDGTIRLAPGPGFGDLSHATTWLVLSLMCEHVLGQSVLDIGCGSGVLSLAAASFGATTVYGIDIDDNAILHAAQNAQLNNLDKQCHFAKCAILPADIILMNMIRSEQKQAYMSLPEVCKTFKKAITSGILKEERTKYLQQTSQWGWKCIQEKQKNGWLGFAFELNM